jgi:hypothetical protein
LLRNIKTEIEELPMSEHENAFDQFVSTIQEHLLIHKKVFYLKHLLADEEVSLRSWVLIDIISAFRRLAVSIASERQMELLYTILDIPCPC